MKEYMFIIRNNNDNFSSLSSEEQTQFLKKCEAYIDKLKKQNQLIEAQPLEREGKIISGNKEGWKENYFAETREVIVGYYHILAENINEAISIAKANPEFEYGASARIEVRPIKVKEESTDYIYPAKLHKP